MLQVELTDRNGRVTILDGPWRYRYASMVGDMLAAGGKLRLFWI